MKILYRILLLIVAVISLTTITNILLTRHQGEVLNADSEQILSQTLVQSLRDALAQDVIDGNKLRVRDLLLSIKGNNNPIEFLYVTGENHEVFTHSFEQSFPAYLVHNQSKHLNKTGIQLLSKFQTSRGLINEYSAALIQGLDITLHIGINQSQFSKILARNTREVLGTSIAIALLTLFAAFVLSKRITDPLSELGRQIGIIGSGEPADFSKLEKADPDIRQLSLAFQSATADLKQAVTQLQEREENLAITLNSIGDAVITTDSEGLVTRMNPIAEALTGWDSSDALGQAVNQVFPIVNATTRDAIPNPVQKVLATGEIVHLSNHTTLIARNGSEYHIADSAAPIRNNEGKVLGMVLVFNDITEQYELRESVRSSQHLLQSLMDDLKSMVGVMEVDGRITFINNMPLEATGASRDEILGRKLSQCSWFQSDGGWEKTVESLCGWAARGEVISQDVIFQGKNEQIWMELGIYPVLDDDGAVIQLVFEGVDISQRKENEEIQKDYQAKLEQQVQERTMELETKAQELAQATRLKSEFLANMSHELRTPMNSIIGFTSRVIKKSADQLEERQLNNLRTVERNAHHLLGLINGLLDLSKIEAGKMEAHPEEFDLAILAKEIITISQPMLEDKSVDLRADIASNTFHLNTDAVKLKQVLINLISNAIKFTHEGSINIIAEFITDQPEPQVSIRVTDTGVGMNQEALQYVFEAFRQVDAALTRKVGGTGLGLAIVKNFTELLRGSVNVESEEGKGTSFELVLPVNLVKSTTLTGAPHSSSIPEFEIDHSKKTVLCIDDEIEAQDLIAAYLSDEGYQVIKASNAEEGVALAKQNRLFAITLDILMPHKDGWSVLSELKADEQTRDIPVFIISFLENKALGYQLGAFDYLSKPVDPERLIESINRLAKSRITNVLVVDDDREARDLLSQTLEDAGIDRQVAVDGNDALLQLKQAGEELPELILLDLMMPGMDGFEFLKEKLKHPDWAAIPVIVVTAKTLEEHERDYLKPRVACILAKEGLTSDAILHQLSASMTYLASAEQPAKK